MCFVIISYRSLPVDNSLWHITLWQRFQNNVVNTVSALKIVYCDFVGRGGKPGKELAVLVYLSFSDSL